MFACLSHLSVWVLGPHPSQRVGVLDRPFCPVLFPHGLMGCLLRSGGNIASRAGSMHPLPRALDRAVQNTPLICLTLDSLQSTSPFVIGDIIIPVYKHRVRSSVYKLGLPERALLVSPLHLFNFNSEPPSHGQAAVNSIPVTGSLSPYPPPLIKILHLLGGQETEGRYGS